RIFIFDSINQALLDSPLMSVGDFIYFTNAGKIQCVSLEGVDNSNKIEKELKRKTKSQSYPVIISLAPSEEIKYKAKIYLGNYQFAKNHAYYLILVYNSKERTDLSNICLKSNRLTLITK
ncbi:MAG: hypothetical protein MUC78_09975, partial [Bacteroidales bacterium]|nr:hypothetical protein [Bacteroidales bacterium]